MKLSFPQITEQSPVLKCTEADNSTVLFPVKLLYRQFWSDLHIFRLRVQSCSSPSAGNLHQGLCVCVCQQRRKVSGNRGHHHHSGILLLQPLNCSLGTGPTLTELINQMDSGTVELKSEPASQALKETSELNRVLCASFDALYNQMLKWEMKLICLLVKMPVFNMVRQVRCYTPPVFNTTCHCSWKQNNGLTSGQPSTSTSWGESIVKLQTNIVLAY